MLLVIMLPLTVPFSFFYSHYFHNYITINYDWWWLTHDIPIIFPFLYNHDSSIISNQYQSHSITNRHISQLIPIVISFYSHHISMIFFWGPAWLHFFRLPWRVLWPSPGTRCGAGHPGLHGALWRYNLPPGGHGRKPWEHVGKPWENHN